MQLLRECCAEKSAAAGSGIRARLPARPDRRLLTTATGVFDARGARLVSRTRFRESAWQVTCDRGAHGTIAHLQVECTRGFSRLLPRPVRVVYLTVVGDRVLQTLDDYVTARRNWDGEVREAESGHSLRR